MCRLRILISECRPWTAFGLGLGCSHSVPGQPKHSIGKTPRSEFSVQLRSTVLRQRVCQLDAGQVSLKLLEVGKEEGRPTSRV